MIENISLYLLLKIGNGITNSYKIQLIIAFVKFWLEFIYILEKSNIFSNRYFTLESNVNL